jgi:hypothetical protein
LKEARSALEIHRLGLGFQGLAQIAERRDVSSRHWNCNTPRERVGRLWLRSSAVSFGIPDVCLGGTTFSQLIGDN